jgi:hypothetical protein
VMHQCVLKTLNDTPLTALSLRNYNPSWADLIATIIVIVIIIMSSATAVEPRLDE